MHIFEKALMVAEQAHKNQTYGIYPYTYHVIQVAEIAKSQGASDDIIVACYLHDVLEDSDISYNDLAKEFGNTIAEIVYDVTDELGRNRVERKRKTLPKIAKNPKAIIVKLCDRISNVQNSIKYGHSMSEKYSSEYDEFRKSLYSSGLEYRKLWNILDGLMWKFQISIDNYNELVDEFVKMRDDKHRIKLRDGQLFFNLLQQRYPNIATHVKGSDVDPFYDDNKIYECGLAITHNVDFVVSGN